jgi:hypothetical protein
MKTKNHPHQITIRRKKIHYAVFDSKGALLLELVDDQHGNVQPKTKTATATPIKATPTNVPMTTPAIAPPDNEESEEDEAELG